MNTEIATAQRYAEWRNPKVADLPPRLIVNNDGDALSMDPAHSEVENNKDVHPEEQKLRPATQREVAAAATGEITVFVAGSPSRIHEMPGKGLQRQGELLPLMDVNGMEKANPIKVSAA